MPANLGPAALTEAQQAYATAHTNMTRTTSWMSPAEFSADVTGVTDASAKIVTCNTASGGYVTLLAGQTYRVSANITINKIVAMGGLLSIDSGVTLIYDEVIGSVTRAVFTGAGIARNSRMVFRLGHYAGASADVRWAFMRQAFLTGVRQTVYFDAPSPGDAGYTTDSYGAPAWIVMAPMIVDDPDDNTTYWQECSFAAGTNITCFFNFSPFNKTEDIRWYGLCLDGMNLALDGLYGTGGARMHFFGRSRIANVLRDAVNKNCSLWAQDETHFDFLESAGFGRNVLNLTGDGNKSGNWNHIAGFRINTLFSNGARALYCTATVDTITNATYSTGPMTGIALNSTKPDGTTQHTAGWYIPTSLSASPGLVYQAYSISKTANSTMPAGQGAVLTPVYNGSNVITGFTINSGGDGFQNGEVIVVTAHDSVASITGMTEHTLIDNLLESTGYSGSFTGLTGPYDALVSVYTNAYGGSRNMSLRDIGTYSSNVTRIKSTNGPLDTTKSQYHTLNISAQKNDLNTRPRSINPSSVSRWFLEIGAIENGFITGSANDFVQSSAQILLGPNVQNVSLGQGFGADTFAQIGTVTNVSINGERVKYLTSMLDQTVTSFDTSNIHSGIQMREVTLLSNTPNLSFKGNYVQGLGWVNILYQGSLVNIDYGSVSQGATTGAAGQFTLYMQNDVILSLNNRTGSTVRVQVKSR